MLHAPLPPARPKRRVPARGRKAHLALACLMLALVSCGRGRGDDSAVQVDVIGVAEQTVNPLRDSVSPAAKAILGATAQGLLAYDARGEVVSALAESWIVEDGGQSYIFRLRRTSWPDGEPVKADQVVRLLQERMRANPLSLAGLSPRLRAMTDRVIEIRLDAPLPVFLQLLAQPQFAIFSRAGGTGPYRATLANGVIALEPMPAVTDPEAEPEPAPAPILQRSLRVHRAALALVRYREGRTDLVLGGRFQHLPLVSAAGFEMRDLRADPVTGLFGLAFVGKSDFLADLSVRDALSRTIDRERLAATLGPPGWRTAVFPLPGPLDLGRQPSAPGWHDRPVEERVASARRVIEAWRAAHDDSDPPVLRIALPEGPGGSVLFIALARDLGQLGVRLDRVALDASADLRLIDEVAPFDSALWYLSRLDCPARIACDPRATKLLSGAREASDPAEQARLLAEAEALIVAHAGYIPLGQPVRWAMAARRLTGFQPSPRGIHPLNRLIAIPN